MNKHKELKLIEELMIDLIKKDEENTKYFDELMNRQIELLDELGIE